MTEETIGKKAATMLENSLRSTTSRFSAHIRTNTSKRIKDVQAFHRMRTSKRQNGSKQKYLRGIAIVMVRHGFVQHYGIQAGRVRAGGERTRRKPRETTYKFRSHLYKKGMKAQPFIDEAVQNSRAVEYLAQELPQMRGEELIVHIKKYLENR